jgi:hypothetical protein
VEASEFKQWAILELMGHRKLAGLVSEENRFGTVMCRIDVPGPDDKSVTQFYGGSSIYAVTPTTEEVCRAFAKRSSPAPISRYELALPATTEPITDADVDDGGDDDFDDDRERNSLP